MNDTKSDPTILQKICNVIVPFCNPDDEIDFDDQKSKHEKD